MSGVEEQAERFPRPDRESAPLLELRDVHTYYGNRHVLHGVTLRAHANEITLLLGRSGAGKSTTVRSIFGLAEVREGEVFLAGRSVRGWPAHRVAATGVRAVAQGQRTFPNLTVEQNLRISAGRRRRDLAAAEAYERFPMLRERRRQSAGTLSGGQQQILALARALAGNPRLLILDEPSEGVAPGILREISKILQEVCRQGVTCLLVEQNLRFALPIANEVFVLNNGRTVFRGSREDLEGDREVQEKYLGVGQ